MGVRAPITAAASLSDEPSTPSCWFIVIRALDAWWVDCEGKGYGPFEDHQTARVEAIHLAQFFGDEHRRNLVYAPDDQGELRVVWSSIPT